MPFAYKSCHHAEISVCRLLGANNGFHPQTVLLHGRFLGVCSGLLALGLVALAFTALNQAIADFPLKLYASEFHMSPLGLLPSLALLVVAKLLGWAGAYLSVRRQLSKLAL